MSVCLVLAVYTLLLHYKLSSAVRKQPSLAIKSEGLPFTRFALFQEDKQGFTVTEATVSNEDDQVRRVATTTPPG